MKKYHFLIALLVVLLDRASKWLITVNITLYDSIPALPGFFRLTHVQNSGAAFGLFDESSSPWKIAILILFSVLALMVVSAMLWKDIHAKHHTRRTGADLGRRNRKPLGSPAQRQRSGLYTVPAKRNAKRATQRRRPCAIGEQLEVTAPGMPAVLRPF